jgi:hypothetical protein
VYKLLVPLLVLLTSVAVSQEPSKLKCEIGPVVKIYGGSRWLVYSCDDNRSLVIVSASDNPAAPFYFTLRAGPKGHRLQGEGAGSREVTSAASKDLSALNEREIDALILETKHVRK